MSIEPSQQQIYEYVKEYLKYWQLNTSLQLFQDQLKKKIFSAKQSNRSETKLQQLLKAPSNKTKNQQQLEKQSKIQGKKYQEVLQAGRQIFSVSINLLQCIHTIKESNSRYDNLNETIENYKIQLGKHHKIIINEGKIEGTQLISQNVIKDHKNKLEQYFKEKNTEGIIEILLSLRVNALQIAPQLRKNLVEELIRRDIFKITATESFDFLLQILNIKNKSLRHAITSLISVIVSILRGIQYITYGGNDIVLQRIIKILKQQDHGNVTQRFCLAILQKCSVKENIMAVYIDNDMIAWVLSLIKKSFIIKIHMFCLDFSTAMLANIIHSKWCQIYLEKKPQLATTIMDQILKFIREPLQISVLMHLLITLSYLCKEKFRRSMEDAHVVKKINQFVQFYESQFGRDTQTTEMDKKTVLDLCSHMFHGKQQQQGDTESRIRQYENQQGELIFQCFQDEVN